MEAEVVLGLSWRVYAKSTSSNGGSFTVRHGGTRETSVSNLNECERHLHGSRRPDAARIQICQSLRQMPPNLLVATTYNPFALIHAHCN